VRSELLQIALQPLELAYPRPDLGATLLNKLQDVRTWGCSGVANRNYLPDLRKT
jgi:hypothetical protein